MQARQQQQQQDGAIGEGGQQAPTGHCAIGRIILRTLYIDEAVLWATAGASSNAPGGGQSSVEAAANICPPASVPQLIMRVLPERPAADGCTAVVMLGAGGGGCAHCSLASQAARSAGGGACPQSWHT